VGPGGESVMKMGEGGDVPGITGQGACQKTGFVVDEVGDDHLDDLLGKSGGGGRACCRNLLRTIRGEHFPDPPGLASIPSSITAEKKDNQSTEHLGSNSGTTW
jgi:hypothetical protein